MTIEHVREAYGERAAEYVELFGEIDAAAELDRRYVLDWARGLDGPVLDAGCGPGQWTDHLRRGGVDVEGVDLVPEFIAAARRRYPDCRFRLGDVRRLGAGDAQLGGVLAWFSLIHTVPEEIGGILAEFARCVRPGGGLLVGFVEGPGPVAFGHAVTTAYSWPIELLSERIDHAGFRITDTAVRADPGVRRQGMIVAERR